MCDLNLSLNICNLSEVLISGGISLQIFTPAYLMDCLPNSVLGWGRENSEFSLVLVPYEWLMCLKYSPNDNGKSALEYLYMNLPTSKIYISSSLNMPSFLYFSVTSLNLEECVMYRTTLFCRALSLDRAVVFADPPAC